MKNKLYYLLFVFYALVILLILAINGVFTGEVVSPSNLIINLIFLVVIGVLFAVSAGSFGRLNRCTSELNNARLAMGNKYKENGNRPTVIDGSNYGELFSDTELRRPLYRYCVQLEKHRTRAGYGQGTDIEDFINEDLIDRIGMSYFNSGISGALTGLGILGTFLGLAIGLGSFQGEDIFTISDNVGPLLSGMKVAFHTSVYGIFFSLLFNLCYRSIMADAYEKLSNFLDAFRQYAQPAASDANADTAAMLVYQANMANALKEMLQLQRGASADQTKALEEIVNRFVEQMTVACGAEFNALGHNLQNVTEAQKSVAENNRTLAAAINELLAANQRLQETVNMSLENQKIFAQELDAQKAQLEKACEDIGNQLYTFQQRRRVYEN